MNYESWEVTGTKEIVIHDPDCIRVTEDGWWRLVFKPAEAREMAALLLLAAHETDGKQDSWYVRLKEEILKAVLRKVTVK